MSEFPKAGDEHEKLVRSPMSLDLGIMADGGNLFWLAYLTLPTGRVEVGRISLIALTSPEHPLARRWLAAMQAIANLMVQTHLPGAVAIDAATVEDAEDALRPQVPSEN